MSTSLFVVKEEIVGVGHFREPAAGSCCSSHPISWHLGDAVRSLRRKSDLTQVQLAERLGSSQSRLAKIESGDPSVSLDLLTRSMQALGASKKDIARAGGGIGRRVGLHPCGDLSNVVVDGIRGAGDAAGAEAPLIQWNQSLSVTPIQKFIPRLDR